MVRVEACEANAQRQSTGQFFTHARCQCRLQSLPEPFRLAAFLAAPGTAPPAIPQERGPVVAAGDEVTPDSDRISRIVTAATGARAEDASPGAGAPPEPSARPTGGAATLAFSSNDR